ncbi:hypothetical protein B0H17DRAFT_1145012 [Mycena rosella]|uniref:Nephrocystin 3-like N-terminal domain-containing protein n=1 Tax=Mycena rosella TaxID=1033263 RepID=A0AAD7CRF6_MYCRO|nr:hypothetical protein B0H17DRAFT_1145012 [Mycena rosella]
MAYFYSTSETREAEASKSRFDALFSNYLPSARRLTNVLTRTTLRVNLPSYKDLLSIIPELLRQLGRTYIIIDALDECNTDDHDRLVALMTTFRQWNETQLHVFFTSQTREIFTAGFEGVPHIALKLFVRTEIQSNHKYKIRRAHVYRITEELHIKATGCSVLRTASSPRSRDADTRRIWTIHSNLPSTLFAVYGRFLAAVPEEDLIYVVATLRWLMFAAKELTLAELADAISFDFSNPDQYTHEPDRSGEQCECHF